MSVHKSASSQLDELIDAFLERQRRGEHPSIQEYAERYPELATEIREVFPAPVLMEEIGSRGGECTESHSELREWGEVPLRLGEFQIVREVGRGGMGIVYEAIQESLGRQVALKVLPPQALANPVQSERFRREAQSAARLHHTNIVPVFAVGLHENIAYYAMQFIHGDSLEAVLHELRQLRASRSATTKPSRPAPLSTAAQGLWGDHALLDVAGGGGIDGHNSTSQQRNVAVPVSALAKNGTSKFGSSGGTARYFRNVARLGVQVAEALEYSHGQGVVHRDIKPANLMLDSGGTVWVTDFGLAKPECGSDLTNSGDILGTLRYMAPEQLNGRADARSDVYSLGITLYELLTMQPAFDDPVKARIIDRIRQHDPPPPGRVEPSIPGDLETIILKAIDKEPHRRYQTAAEMVEDLRRFLADRPVRRRRTGWIEHGWRWCRRNRTMAGLIGSVALLVSVVIPTILLAYSLRLRNAAHVEKAARQEAQQHLYSSLVDQARASHTSRRPGQRFTTLRAIADAAGVLRHLPLNAEDLRQRKLDLRNAAIAGMALTDLRLQRNWKSDPNHLPIAFDPTFAKYVSRSTDHDKMFLCRSADHQILTTFTGDFVHPLFSPDGQFLAASEQRSHSVMVWKGENPQPVLTRSTEQVKNTHSFDFSPDSRQFGFADPQGRVELIDLATGRALHEFKVLGEPSCMAYSPSGSRLAVAESTTIHLFDPRQGTEIGKLEQKSGVGYLAWHPDGNLLATVAFDGQIHVWDVNRRRISTTMSGQRGGGVVIAFDQSGEILASIGWSALMRLWDLRTGQQLMNAVSDVQSVRFHAQQSLLAHYVWHNEVGIWEMARPREFRTLVRNPLPSQVKAILPAARFDNRLLAVGMSDGVGLWDMALGKELAFLPIRNTHPAFEPGPSGALLLNGSDGVYRWPILADAERINHLRLGSPEKLFASRVLHAMATSADGQVIALAHRNGASVWRADQPDRTLPLDHKDDVRMVSVSPDGKLVATGSFTTPVARVWESATGKLIKEIRGSSVHLDVRFSPDGKWLLAGGRGQQLYRTDKWEKGSYIDAGRIEAGFFSPDGKILAVEDGRGFVRLVDPETGRDYARLTNPDEDRVVRSAFSSDGTRLVTLNNDSRSIHVWDLRVIRAKLAETGLDWDLPAYPPVDAESEPLQPLTLDVGTALLNLDAPQFLRDKKPKDAVAAWKESLKIDPHQADVCLRLGRLLLTVPVRDPAAALPLADLAVKLDPSENSYMLRADVHYALKAYRSALDDYSHAIERNGELAAAHHSRAHCHMELGDAASAISDWLRSLSARLK